MKKAALHNLGCKVNAYECEAMGELLEQAGYEIVPFESFADVYVINTCTVTNMADRKSRQMLHRAKKQNPEAIVVAAGCYAQTGGDQLRKDLSVDLIIGNNRKQELVSELDKIWADRALSAQTGDDPTEKEALTDDDEQTPANRGAAHEQYENLVDINQEKTYEKMQLTKTAEHTRAYIKVQDGCNQFCSYCIIPYARGRVRSRELSDILTEVETLAKAGYREVVLTGIHLSSYGIDFVRETGDGDYLKKGAGILLDLIRSVGEIPGIERIRLGSLEPRIITDEFASELARIGKVCPHFHLSLQSGCDETLKRMNRHYTAKEYMDKCEILRKYFPYPALTTDVIVGFPGESEEEFAASKAFVDAVSFYETHIFKYSVRKGTRAAAMKEQIPEPVKNVRSGEMIELNAEKMKSYEAGLLGRDVELLVEESVTVDGRTWQIGHTKEYVKAGILSEVDMAGKILCGKAGDEIKILNF